MKSLGHPSTHGWHTNPYTCGRTRHELCDGFSGDYDTYTCGCCCHDLERGYEGLTDNDRTWITRARPLPASNK